VPWEHDVLMMVEDLGDDSLDAPFEKAPDGAKEAARAGAARDAEGAQRARRDPRHAAHGVPTMAAGEAGAAQQRHAFLGNNKPVSACSSTTIRGR